MSAAVTEVLRDGYMGRLTSIRTLQLLAGMDNLTAAKRCCVSPRPRRSDRVVGWIGVGTVRSVVIASVTGAITSVCGLGVLPLIAALLRRRLPLAPVMAFRVSAPIPDPGMLVVTACIPGIPFAVAKTVAAFAIGLLAGAITATVSGFAGPDHQFMRADPLAAGGCRESASGLLRESGFNTRLVARWLAGPGGGTRGAAAAPRSRNLDRACRGWRQPDLDPPGGNRRSPAVSGRLCHPAPGTGACRDGDEPWCSARPADLEAAVSLCALRRHLPRPCPGPVYIAMAVPGACLAGYPLEGLSRVVDLR